MFESLISDISEGFSDLLPHEFCLPCFFKGLAQGLAIGLSTLLLIALLPEAAALAVTVALVTLGVAGLAKLAATWHTMSDDQKSEVMGNIVGGVAAGGVGKGGFGAPMPKLVLMPGPGGTAALDLVMAEVAVGGTTQAGAVAGVASESSILMMSGGGGSGGGTPPQKKGPIPDEAPQNLEEQILLKDAKGREATGKNDPIQGGPGRPLGDEPRLIDNYGGNPGEWVKLRGPNQEINGVPTEVHYFKNTRTGQTAEWKFKRQPKGSK